MENIYDKKSNELPTWIGVCQVRYYTKQEVREILKGLVNSHIFRPYFYSDKAVMVTKYEKGHPYWDNEIHCLVVTSDGYIPSTKLNVNADTGIDKMTSHIWDLLKKSYTDIDVDIDNMMRINYNS